MEMTILSNEEMMMIDGGIDWGEIATGMAGLGGLIIGVICAPVAIPAAAAVVLVLGAGACGAAIGDGIQK